jgi:polysaccharide export outer membrane protein
MGHRRTLFTASWGLLSAGLLAGLVAGCAMLPPNSFIDPTKVGRFGLDANEGGIRRVLTPRDTPPGIPTATDPTADDLVPAYQEYRLHPGDQIALTIQDLLNTGQPYSVGLQVNTLGEIRIPDLGTVRVAGLTEQEIEREIAARLEEGGLLANPLVLVFAQSRRGRTFTVLGNVGAPGTYPIIEADMRMLEALGLVGDIAATAQEIYVIRREDAGFDPERVVAARRQMDSPPAEPAAPDIEEEWVIPPPVEPETPAPAYFSTSVGYAAADEDPDDVPPTRAELESILAPRPVTTAPETAPATAPGEPVRSFEPLVFDPETGQLIEVAPPAEDAASEPAMEVADEQDLDEPFDWEDVDEFELEQRVISINVRELKNGNPRYNIVVRNKDVLNVPIDTGVFYMMGEINRPGVYAFGGRDITMKQAIAISGGFSALAWPSRCEIIRREPGTDKQFTTTVNLDAIFAGLEDDFYLRSDDIVNVGTHIVAPFLFVIRNSFRFTYGFGFVYDRNFADKDQFGPRQNPYNLEQQRRLQRGLPF